MSNNITPRHAHRINCITNEIEALYHAAARKLGLSDSVLFVYYMLCDFGGSCPLHEIHGAGVCKQTVNSAVRRLEREGMVRLQPGRRGAKQAELTPAGRRFAQTRVMPLLEAEERVFAGWRDGDIADFTALLQQYLTDFGAQIDALPDREEATE